MLKNENFNIFGIAEKNKMKRFIHFRVTLRDKINYDIELINGYLNFTGDAKNRSKRHVIYCCQTYFRENQIVPPRCNSYFVTYKPFEDLYNYETTVIDILLECSDNDFKKALEEVKQNGVKIRLYLYELLEYFSYKYNLAVSGNDFLEASELCTGGFRCFFFYKNNKTQKYENAYSIISPSFSLIKNQQNSNLNFQRVVNTKIPAWKFFVNKTKFNYLAYNNLECVINASIALESYLIYLIKQKKTYNQYKKQYKKQLSFKSALKFCLDNKIITEDFALECDKGYKKIGVNRSLIIHGVIDTPIIDREQAKKAYETIVSIFSKIDNELYANHDLLSNN